MLRYVCGRNSLVSGVKLIRTTNSNINVRWFSSNIEDEFKSAVGNVSKLKNEPDNDVKLKLYALYKQSTVGECNQQKPGALDFVGKYKWQAWKDLGALAKADAMQQYVNTVGELIAKDGGGEEKPVNVSEGVGDSLVVTNKEGVLMIRINRPKKRNSITLEMYLELTKLLNESASNDSIRIAVLTGTGDFFSSGNDLSKYTKISSKEQMMKEAESGKVILKNFVDSFINYPKPLIAAVNGPALGIMVTTLALCDVIVCSENATFQTPFSSTAQVPEGCSSFTFPSIFGYSKANMMLLFNQKITAKEAFENGFVAKVLPAANFTESLEAMLYGEKSILANAAQGSLIASKALIRNDEMKAKLRQVNANECDVLIKRWFAPEFANFIAKFFSRK